SRTGKAVGAFIDGAVLSRTGRLQAFEDCGCDRLERPSFGSMARGRDSGEKKHRKKTGPAGGQQAGSSGGGGGGHLGAIWSADADMTSRSSPRDGQSTLSRSAAPLRQGSSAPIAWPVGRCPR